MSPVLPSPYQTTLQIDGRALCPRYNSHDARSILSAATPLPVWQGPARGTNEGNAVLFGFNHIANRKDVGSDVHIGASTLIPPRAPSARYQPGCHMVSGLTNRQYNQSGFLHLAGIQHQFQRGMVCRLNLLIIFPSPPGSAGWISSSVTVSPIPVNSGVNRPLFSTIFLMQHIGISGLTGHNLIRQLQ